MKKLNVFVVLHKCMFILLLKRFNTEYHNTRQEVQERKKCFIKTKLQVSSGMVCGYEYSDTRNSPICEHVLRESRTRGSRFHIKL